MKKIDLYTFLKDHEGAKTPIGDLASDALPDDTFPRGSHTLGYYRKYLDSHNACDGAIEALKKAYSLAIRKQQAA